MQEATMIVCTPWFLDAWRRAISGCCTKDDDICIGQLLHSGKGPRDSNIALSDVLHDCCSGFAMQLDDLVVLTETWSPQIALALLQTCQQPLEGSWHLQRQ